MSDRATLTVADGVAELRLVRADAHNGIDPAMVEALAGAAEALTVRDDARALLICADGPAFTVGGDLQYFAGAAREGRFRQAVEPMVEPYHDALHQLYELPMPVVAAIHGPTAGGGLGIAYVADVVIAADDLRLATGFAAIALSGDGASSWWLPRLVGLRRAQELLLENRVLDAATALEWGVVTRVVPRDDLDAEARRTVAAFAAGPAGAYKEMKALLRASAGRTLREHYDAELDAMARTGGSADAAEGIVAFTEKRRPEFGR